MPRKTEYSLATLQNSVKKKYKRGPRVEKVITGESQMSESEKYVKREIACYLKAQDFSWNYIADSLGMSKDVLKRWWADPDLGMKDRVAEIHDDLVSGAVKLLKTYAIELIEGLMVIFRTSEDEGLVVKLGLELLDRLGIAKVNKSESVVASTNRDEVALTDPDGMMEKLRDMSPERASEIAAKLEEAFSMVDAGGSE